MVTLRTYANPVDAAIAKSILDEHNIVCSLADENANVYGGAPFAMPVRLMVSEKQADEALRILETMAQQHSDQIEKLNSPEQESSTTNELADMLAELKKLRSRIETNTIFVVLLFVGLVFYFLIQLYLPAPTRSRQRQAESWSSARTALDNFQYDKAMDIAQRLTEKTPNYYYGYAYLGHIALERDRLKDAEGYFARAYELFPTDQNRQQLEAVRKRLAAEGPK
jgi:tetratricopeptide (TPR) repeat protein